MYRNHTHCRACGYGKAGANGIKSAPTERLIEAFDLGVQPLANDFCKNGESHAGYAPLKVMFCPRCTLAQLSVVVEPSILYSHYNYVTSPSEMMREHFERLIADIAGQTNEKSVLEIGSNDGRLLALMKEKGYTVMGVDPAENLGGIARAAGIVTQTGFFSEELSRVLHKVDIVIARHVFCHVDDWHDFMRGLENVSHQETLICIEAPYAGNTLKNCEWDQIYHEHLSYLSLKSIMALLENTPFKLHKIIHYPIHGGVVLLMIRRKDSVQVTLEAFSENFTIDDWKKFGVTARDNINRLSAAVRTFRAQGKTVVGLGASAKSTVWINACGFTRNEIAFITDNTPQKQLTFSPGSDIPIMDEGAILRDLPDYVIVFAWNYRDEILKKFELARSKGVKFIIPVPRIEIVQ